MTGVAFLCGLGLALAFPRAGLLPLAWCAPVPWLALVVHATPARAFRASYAFGLGFFGLLLAFVQRVLAYYTSLPPYVSVPIWALLIGYLAIYPAVFGAWVAVLSRRIGMRALALAPFVWVALEIAREHVLGGFPWGSAGYARAGGLALLQSARLGGINLVSLLLVASWCALAVLLAGVAAHSRGRMRTALRAVGITDEARIRVSKPAVWTAGGVLALVLVTTLLGAVRLRSNPPVDVSVDASHDEARVSRSGSASGSGPATEEGGAGRRAGPEPGADPAQERARSEGGARPPLRVALIQGGYGGDLDFAQAQAALGDYLRLSREAAGHRPDLIVWPESNAPFQPERSADYLAILVDLSRRTDAALLLGAVGGSPEKGLTNSAYWIDPSGIRGRYDKRRLVQYGEYVPMRGAFPFIRKFVPEAGEFLPGTAVGVLPIAGRAAGVSICYEMIFPEEIRRQALAGADLLINLTNDSWYTWGGPWQHAEFSSARAIETGLYTLRAASTGRTLVIDPLGRVLKQGPLGGPAVVEADIPAVRRPSATPFVRAGDWPGGACVTISTLTLAFLGVGNIIDKRRRTAFRRQGNPRR